MLTSSLKIFYLLTQREFVVYIQVVQCGLQPHKESTIATVVIVVQIYLVVHSDVSETFIGKDFDFVGPEVDDVQGEIVEGVISYLLDLVFGEVYTSQVFVAGKQPENTS